MMTESPINSANDLMRSIAMAMDALLAFWRNPSPEVVKVGGIHRNLSLSGDTPKYTESQYPIWECISRYKELQKDGGMSE